VENTKDEWRKRRGSQTETPKTPKNRTQNTQNCKAQQSMLHNFLQQDTCRIYGVKWTWKWMWTCGCGCGCAVDVDVDVDGHVDAEGI